MAADPTKLVTKGAQDRRLSQVVTHLVQSSGISEGVESRDKSKLDLKKLEESFQQGLSKIESAKGKEVILILGNTGSGKSTFTNYMLEHPLKKEQKSGKLVIDVDDHIKASKQPYAKVGHQYTKSETLHPEVFYNPRQKLAYCDCPGFEDTGDIERRVTTIIGTELVVKLASRIKSIVVVINYADINAVKGNGFKKLVGTLSRLFKNVDEVAGSIFFVVTSAPSEINTARFLESISEIFKEHKKEYINVKKSKRLPSVEPTQWEETYNIEKILEILQLIQDYSHNVLVINPLDGGKSRNQIMSWLKSKDRVDVSKDAFNFGDYSADKRVFDQLIFDVAERGTKLLKHRSMLTRKIMSYDAQIAMLKKDIHSSNSPEARKLQEVENALKDIEQQFNVVFLDDLSVATIKKTIEQVKLKLETLKNDINSEIFIEDSIYEERLWFGFLGWTRKVFEFNKPEVPFSKVLATQKNGKFVKTKDELLKQGYYYSVYESNFFQTGIAKVEIWVEKRNLPESQRLIKCLQAELKENQEALVRKQALADASVQKLSDEVAEHRQELSRVDQEVSSQKAFLLVEKISQIMQFRQPLLTEFLELLEAQKQVLSSMPSTTRMTGYQIKVQQCLYEAISKGRKELAISCLKVLPMINSKEPYWASSGSDGSVHAIFVLARFGHHDWIASFSQYLRPMFSDEQERTALHVAARYGQQEFCKELIDTGFIKPKGGGKHGYLWPKDKRGQTPFHYAAIGGHIDLIQKLAKDYYAAEELQDIDKQGDTIVHLLIRYHHKEALVKLFSKIEMQSIFMQKQNKQGHDPVMEAVLTKDRDVLDCILKQQVDVGLRDVNRRTALHLAVRLQELDLVESLVSKGFFLEAKDFRGRRPIDYANPDSQIGVYFTNHIRKKYPREHLVSQPRKIRNLIFQGGSIKLLAYPAALRCLKEQEIVDLSGIRRVGGTSAGAIMALAVGLGFSLEEIDHLMAVKPLLSSTLSPIEFSKLLDGSFAQKLLAAKNKDWHKVFGKEHHETLERLKQIDAWLAGIVYLLNGGAKKTYTMLKEFSQNIQELYKKLKNDKGLCEGVYLRTLLDNLISHQYEKVSGKKVSNITFKELAEYKVFKSMYFLGVNLDTGQEEIFSYQTTPHMVVADAVRISASIPFLFRPHRKVTKEKNGQLSYSTTVYIDGGVTGNYPVELFDSSIYYGSESEEATGNKGGQKAYPEINHETLGLRLVSSKLKTQYESPVLSESSMNSDSGETLWTHIQSVISALSFSNVQENVHVRQRNDFRTVYIDTLEVGMLDFDKADLPKVKREMAEQGRQAALDFRRRFRQNPVVPFRLPSGLDKVVGKFLVHLKAEVGENGEYKEVAHINPNCPELVLAFYELPHEHLHQHLHQVLGISIYARDELGNTAFHLAAQAKKSEVLERLFKVAPSGGMILNDSGKTPEMLLKEPKLDNSVSVSSKSHTSGFPCGCLWRYLGWKADVRGTTAPNSLDLNRRRSKL